MIEQRPREGSTGRFVLGEQERGLRRLHRETRRARRVSGRKHVGNLVLHGRGDGAPCGAPIASSSRWRYALGKLGFIYMHNGTDMKFFDGRVFRDIGLPALTTAQVTNSIVNPGLAAITPTQAAAVDNAFSSTDGLNWDDPNDRAVYLAFFDPAT